MNDLWSIRDTGNKAYNLDQAAVLFSRIRIHTQFEWLQQYVLLSGKQLFIYLSITIQFDFIGVRHSDTIAAY